MPEGLIKPGEMKHQRKKFLKLFPERERKSEFSMKKGSEASSIKAFKSEISGNKVVKSYPTKGKNPVSFEEMVARFKLQKELYSKGYPVARPIKIEYNKKTGEIRWEEELIGTGKTYREMYEELLQKGKLSEAEFVKKKYETAADRLNKSVKPGELEADLEEPVQFMLATMGREIEMDVNPDNAIWDPEKKRFVFTDLLVYRKGMKK